MSKYQWIVTKLGLCIDIEKIWLLIGKLSASVAQLDTRSTGDQEVRPPPRSATFFRGD